MNLDQLNEEIAKHLAAAKIVSADTRRYLESLTVGSCVNCTFVEPNVTDLSFVMRINTTEWLTCDLSAEPGETTWSFRTESMGIDRISNALVRAIAMAIERGDSWNELTHEEFAQKILPILEERVGNEISRFKMLG